SGRGVALPADASSLEDAEQTEEPEPGSEAAAHLADLKRINAEYAAYRMRADRERERAALGGTIKVVEALIPVLDEVKLARENGDVTGPFETHVNKLVDSLAKLGVEQYGEVGDEFDPNITKRSCSSLRTMSRIRRSSWSCSRAIESGSASSARPGSESSSRRTDRPPSPRRSRARASAN